tara:strand:+ start:1322 stop:2476 length:1155 start_codon:yes stop_codon:yes gene_type:complete
MQMALKAIGNPCASIPAIQIVGTNGKGSIASFLQSGLKALGIKGGITTSPHLISWCERICINSEQITRDDLQKRLNNLNPLVQSFHLTTFELLIATALNYFNDNNVDLLVLEVGLGGRLDATTAHPYRPIIAIGGIGLDHCEYLGKSIKDIALEKTAVISPNCTVISSRQDPEVEEVINSVVEKQNATLHWVEPLSHEWRLGLEGEIQRYNAAVAKGALEALTKLGWEVDQKKIKEGLARASWPGRLQTIYWKNMPILIDCAHNPHAAKTLSEERRKWSADDTDVQWIIGIQKHKDAPGILKSLVKSNDAVYIVPVPECLSWTPKELLANCPLLSKKLNGADNIEQALSDIYLKKNCSNPFPVITGSIYLIGDLLKKSIHIKKS